MVLKIDFNTCRSVALCYWEQVFQRSVVCHSIFQYHVFRYTFLEDRVEKTNVRGAGSFNFQKVNDKA